MVVDKDEDGCIQDKGNERKVRFLYKFVPGVTLSSFGLGVAEMAGMLDSVIIKAEKVSNNFNKSITKIKRKLKKKGII